MKDSAELRELVYFTCYPADRKVRATEMFKAAMLGLWHDDPIRYNRVGLLALKAF